MAESDIQVGIQVGSTVRYVGFRRDGAQGPAGDGGLVRPPKPPTEAPTLNAYDIATDPELVESLSARVFNVLASSPKVPYTDVGIAIIESAIRAQLKSGSGIDETAIRAAEIRAADAANHLDQLLDGVQCRCVALPAPADSGPNIADLGTDVTDEYPLLRGSGGPTGEAPPLNTLDLVEGPDGILWAVVRQSGDTMELNHPLGGCRYASPDEVKQWPRKGRLDPSSYWAEDIQRLRARTYTVTAITIIENSDKSDPRQTKDAVNVIVDESGPGIAASPVNWKRQPTACSALGKPLPRPATRHQTTSWDPDMPLEDAEPGRYGWLP